MTKKSISLFVEDVEALVPLGDALYGLHVFGPHDSLYVENPKCGCTSVKYSIASLECDSTYPPEFLHDRSRLPTRHPKIVQGKLVFDKPRLAFSVVRSPYARALSCWLNKIDNSSSLDYVSFERKGLCNYADLSLTSRIDFQDFLSIVSSMKTSEMNPHYRPQWIQIMGDLIEYDYLIRLERLSVDLALVLKRAYDFDSLPAFANYLDVNPSHSTRSASRVAEYYSDSCIKLVNAIYQCDFDMLGFEYSLVA